MTDIKRATADAAVSGLPAAMRDGVWIAATVATAARCAIHGVDPALENGTPFQNYANGMATQIAVFLQGRAQPVGS
jgi:hypothetical protein